MKRAITPTRQENFPEWYQQLVKAAELAEHSPVRGCMVIKPWGYMLWENIQSLLDKRLKAAGHQNAYFPLLIPLKYLEKEATHVEGFAKECGVVTHHRLKKGEGGQLMLDGKLEEPLIIRPTSETIIMEMFSKWIKSYRDLPLRINQWANVFRWEMRVRLFLRTAEFLWQEGHTAHATKEEALKEALHMLNLYKDFAENILAIPIIEGEKTENERFPGAISTYSIEAMMQDGKALQMGTSHFLGQNFSKASNITFQDSAGKLDLAWTTSWGVSTRLIGGIIMAHSDDDGLILPPRIAPVHIVIIPLVHHLTFKEGIYNYCHKLKEKLATLSYMNCPLEVHIDERDMRSGEKIWSWIKKGVPIRVEVGPRELEKGYLTVTKRHRGHKEREKQSEEQFACNVIDQLEEIQQKLFQKAKCFRMAHLREINTKEEFYQFFKKERGFASAHWSGDPSIEETLQKELNVSIRSIPMNRERRGGTCPFSGGKSNCRVIFAKAY